jgi:CheY-like chemotaxis protein
VYICAFVAFSSPARLVGRRILVVDDDRVALTILCSMLRAEGAEVESAGTGRDALGLLRRSRFDFLLCDVYMPDMDGFELIRQVRLLAPGAGSSVPAVAITAHPSFENRRDAQRAGFQDLVTKPVEASALVDVVLRLCRPGA